MYIFILPFFCLSFYLLYCLFEKECFDFDKVLLFFSLMVLLPCLLPSLSVLLVSLSPACLHFKDIFLLCSGLHYTQCALLSSGCCKDFLVTIGHSNLTVMFLDVVLFLLLFGIWQASQMCKSLFSIKY